MKKYLVLCLSAVALLAAGCGAPTYTIGHPRMSYGYSMGYYYGYTGPEISVQQGSRWVEIRNIRRTERAYGLRGGHHSHRPAPSHHGHGRRCR